MTDLIDLLVSILATWRITNLLVDDNEDGPYDILPKLRYRLGLRYDAQGRAYPTNEVSKAINCFWCASFWVGLGVALLPKWARFILWPFAYSAGALWMRRHIK